MKTSPHLPNCLALSFALAISLWLQPPVQAESPALRPFQELTPRDGLPNFFEKAKGGGDIAVAYFGGSITAAPGWRVKSLEWLKERYPTATFREVNAAIGGTGSDLGAFRVRQDVIDHEPDLVFVEFAVNDGGTAPEQIQRTMEGIVRQIWNADPLTDICFAYTLAGSMLGDLQGGHFQRSASAMEVVADHYGIPTIHFGGEIAKQVSEGRLIFKGTKEQADDKSGLPVFSTDGVHPLVETGHAIYQEVLARSLTSMEASGQPGPHKQAGQEPLHADNWENARIFPVTRSMLSGTWEEVPTGDADPFKGFRHRLGKIWSTRTPGSALEFTIEGRHARVYDIIGPSSGILSITVGEAAPKKATRFDSHCTYRRLSNVSVATFPEFDRQSIRVELTGESPDKAKILGPEKAADIEKEPARYRVNSWHIGAILVIGKVVDYEPDEETR